MCGIVGAAARRDIVPVLIEGLRRLEYRGYDSAGVAVSDHGLKRVRALGRVAALNDQVQKEHLTGHTGIAHTRWATHGVPSEANAHPHISGSLAVVHNGIIENHESIRSRLRGEGYKFTSETDTEVIAHLVEHYRKSEKDLFAAVVRAVAELEGAFAIAVVSGDAPDTVVLARKGAPLLLGLGEGENFAGSDVSALLQVTRRVIYLEDGDCAEIKPDSYRIQDADRHPVERKIHISEQSASAAELGNYQHYMQKEIFEQPDVVADATERVRSITPALFGAKAQSAFSEIDSLLLLACGTSYYSALTAKYWLESIAGIPTQVEIASEYRYRESVVNPCGMVVVVSQSGETADTLAALKHAQQLGYHHTLAICNVPHSSMMRLTELQYPTGAGPEIGVASTKAFTTQLVALYLLALTLAKERGRVSADDEALALRQLHHLPAALNSVLALEPQIVAWAQSLARKDHALFLGRGVHYPIALEGALKLKEISYVHAEAYPAGELKHGPLAIVTSEMPVITVAPNDALLDKLKSNMQEVRARGGELYVLADAGTKIENTHGVRVIQLPEHYGPLSPILHVVPLQLLAYHTACVRGTDVDKPRNLAKSVTVE